MDCQLSFCGYVDLSFLTFEFSKLCVLRQIKKIAEAFQILKTETSELIHVCPDVPVLSVDETLRTDWPFRFYRVAQNYPVVIRGGYKHFSAVSKWNSRYFLDTIPNKEVTVVVKILKQSELRKTRLNLQKNKLKNVNLLNSLRVLSQSLPITLLTP
ncbi:uncharacterized protein LOC123008971 [Tribolium madens]|uniref:uncharacterized protein LOC123008970 n=1 Tax=Tribolium madens TaxID=41895 RepID=UPI001CF7545E|nr:uncharacterized protein LOC123008970 [Tribolium madens]XP_044260989.1 uncharacterized protein LOC123008971 [Tribolium madens]